MVSTIVRESIWHVGDDSWPRKESIKKINAKNVIAYDFIPVEEEVLVVA